MASERTQSRDLLLRQFDVAWQLAWYHLETLTDDECQWRPAARGLRVHHHEGRWTVDWPTHEGHDLGASSAAWIGWHWLFWWRMVIDQTWGAGTLTWPFRERSLGDLFAWANTELTKSAAELGMVRFLYVARPPTEP